MKNLRILALPVLVQCACAFGEPAESMRQIIAQREGIESARLRVKVVKEIDKSDKEAYWKSRADIYEFRLLDKHRRVDTFHEGVRANGNHAKSSEQNIFNSDGAFIYRPIEKDVDVMMGDGSRVISPGINRGDIDPRAIGLSFEPFDQLGGVSLGDSFAIFFSPGAAVSEEIMGNVKTLKSTFTSADDKAVNVEVVVDGHGVSSYMVMRPDFVLQAKITNKLWANGSWFPSEVVLTREHGREIAYQERQIVEALDTPYAGEPGEFELGAIAMEPGRTVLITNPLGSERKIWDGVQLTDDPVLVRPADTDLTVSVKPRSRWVSYLMICNSAFFAVLASVLLLRRVVKGGIKSELQ